MTVTEAEDYYDNLSVDDALQFNSLVKIALTLGKPIEGAYEYAKTIMEEKTNDAQPDRKE